MTVTHSRAEVANEALSHDDLPGPLPVPAGAARVVPGHAVCRQPEPGSFGPLACGGRRRRLRVGVAQPVPKLVDVRVGETEAEARRYGEGREVDDWPDPPRDIRERPVERVSRDPEGLEVRGGKSKGSSAKRDLEILARPPLGSTMLGQMMAAFSRLFRCPCTPVKSGKSHPPLTSTSARFCSSQSNLPRMPSAGAKISIAEPSLALVTSPQITDAGCFSSLKRVNLAPSHARTEERATMRRLLAKKRTTESADSRARVSIELKIDMDRVGRRRLGSLARDDLWGRLLDERSLELDWKTKVFHHVAESAARGAGCCPPWLRPSIPGLLPSRGDVLPAAATWDRGQICSSLSPLASAKPG